MENVKHHGDEVDAVVICEARKLVQLVLLRCIKRIRVELRCVEKSWVQQRSVERKLVQWRCEIRVLRIEGE